MDLQLHGKTALISGASAGIGFATTKIMAREGVQTIVVGRRADSLAALAEEVRAEGHPTPVSVVDDLLDGSAFDRVVDQVMEPVSYTHLTLPTILRV